ncbi:Uncharacterised protein [Vibrio cholerae]|nr:Uncharacterised protein [Vibrio cholerae]
MRLPLAQFFQNRQDETGGFTRACLRSGNQITSLQNHWNRLGLNMGRFLVTKLRYGLYQNVT